MERIGREELDAYAYQSQQRAVQAWAEERFSHSIIPISDATGLLILDRDESIRPQVTPESLADLRPAFLRDGERGFAAVALQRYPEVECIHYRHTAGNSCGLADGASVVLLGSEKAGTALNKTPRARIVACATASVDPTIMLTGPTVATQRVLQKAGLKTKDIDLWECNEAFAAVPLKFQKDLKIDPESLNVNGGAIALGHPLGATGAMLLGTLVDELERQDRKRGLVTLCAGAGLAVATIIERV
jgi:acetyl-CoA C-acetyltransferase